MRPTPNASTRVKILNIEYSVTGYEDAQYLHEVAGLVDQRMRSLMNIQADMPSLKNAILTALNLADELLRTRKQLAALQSEAADFGRRVADRSRKLSELCTQIQVQN